MTYVPPSGDPSAPYVVCGEAPGAEEVRMGRGLWPEREAALARDATAV